MDANRRTRYGWMALGGLVCLFVVVLAAKMTNGNKAHAEEPKAGQTPVIKVEKASAPATLPPLGDNLPTVPPPGDTTPPPPLAGSSPDVPKAPDIKPTADFAPPPPPGSAPPPSVPSAAPATGSESRPILIPAAGTSGNPTPPPVSDVPPPVAPGVLPPMSPPPASVPPAPPVSKPEAPPVTVSPPAPPNVIIFHVKTAGMTIRTLAQKTLGTGERWSDIHKLNPTIAPDTVLTVGATVNLPPDAHLVEEEVLQALPTLRARPAPRPRAVLPLTGTFPVVLSGRALTLPKAVMEQLANCDTVLVSPGSSKCLWITNQAHLDRLGTKLDKSPAREADVQAFKRLYFAQISKLPVREGRFVLSEKLAQFAGLGGEVVLVGIDDHFEVWDAATWRKFTATRKGSN